MGLLFGGRATLVKSEGLGRCSRSRSMVGCPHPRPSPAPPLPSRGGCNATDNHFTGFCQRPRHSQRSHLRRRGHFASPNLVGRTAGTKSFALIVDDPDAPDPAAPKRTWVHWVLYNLPADSRGLADAIDPAALPAGTREGTNDWKRTGYGGPCPPSAGTATSSNSSRWIPC